MCFFLLGKLWNSDKMRERIEANWSGTIKTKTNIIMLLETDIHVQITMYQVSLYACHGSLK